jgi:PAS domain S-box-containing protein
MGVGMELKAIKKGGQKFPVEISLSPIRTDEGMLVSVAVRDISERKNAEELLRKSENSFHLLVNSVKDYAIFMVDLSGKVASWNSGAESIKGYRSAEIIGQNIDIFYTEEQRKKNEPQYNLQMARLNGHYETEGLRVRKDGTTFYANIVFTALHNDNGELYGYAKITRDITEKRKADDRIRFLAVIAGNIKDAVISSDNNFVITGWNEAAEQLLGWTAEETVGKDAGDILKISYPFESREQIFTALNSNGYWQGELVYQHKSGASVDVLTTISHLKDSAGQVTGNLLLVKDNTNRKQAELLLNNLNKELSLQNRET